MAVFKNDPFPGTDYTQYLNWTKVVLPNGETYYEVPGHPGYVYDPVASSASGRTVFRANPKGAIADAQKAKDQQDAAIKQQQFNQSPLGQILPVAASTGGLIAASQLGAFGGGAAPVVLPSLASAAAQGAAGTAAAAPIVASAPIAAAAPAAAASAAPAVAGVAPAAASTGILGTGLGVLPLAGIAAGTYLGGKSAYDMLMGKSDNSIQGKIGRGTLGIATGGLSEIARPFLMHKSTRDIAKEHTNDLLEQGKDDASYQNYVNSMREQYNSAPVDPSKPFAGKYGSFDEYQKAGLEAADLSGVYGNIKTYGPEWANLTQAQREAVTQANIDSGLYVSNKGEVEITDPNKAIENKNNVLKGFQVGAQTQAQAAAQGAQVPIKTIPKPLYNQPVRR